MQAFEDTRYIIIPAAAPFTDAEINITWERYGPRFIRVDSKATDSACEQAAMLSGFKVSEVKAMRHVA